MSPKPPQRHRPETQWDTHRPKGHPHSREQESQAVQMPTAPRELSDDRRTGSMMSRAPGDDLSRRVMEALQEDEGLAPYGLRADVVDGIARVQGMVETLAERRHVDEVVRSVPGLRGVENAVSISTDGSIDDADVEMEVAQELGKLPFGDDVTPKAERGRVTLFGTVPDEEAARQAEAAAARARGVTGVISRLRVGPGDITAEEAFHSQVRNDPDSRNEPRPGPIRPRPGANPS
ncbi:MAG TPA: BON domain-containing protein [Limnochorda sp.]